MEIPIILGSNKQHSFSTLLSMQHHCCMHHNPNLSLSLSLSNMARKILVHPVVHHHHRSISSTCKVHAIFPLHKSNTIREHRLHLHQILSSSTIYQRHKLVKLSGRSTMGQIAPQQLTAESHSFRRTFTARGHRATQISMLTLHLYSLLVYIKNLLLWQLLEQNIMASNSSSTQPLKFSIRLLQDTLFSSIMEMTQRFK